MFPQSQQISTIKVSHWPHSIKSGVMASWLITAAAIASLLVGLIWILNEVRYPGAARQATDQFQVSLQYQTSDDLPKVMRWYVQHFGLSHEVPQGESCVMLTGESSYLILKQSIAVTLCAQQKRTLIFVDRSIALR